MRLKNKTNRKAFSMIELIFVIVIMGILGKFGVEFLFQAYNGFIQTKVNNELQANSGAAVEYVSSKLKNRIKASIIVREKNDSFTYLDGYTNATAPILEWVGADIEGFRGDVDSYWTGVLDLQASDKTKLVPIGGDLTKLDAMIKVLSNDKSSLADAAIYFVGSDRMGNSDAGDVFGWDENVTSFNKKDLRKDMRIHPIKNTGGDFTPVKSTGLALADGFTGVEAYEYYQLAWTAYAIGIDDYVDDLTDSSKNFGTLTLWYDYQPWQGETYRKAKRKIPIMNNVSSFQFLGVNGLVKIQVCAKSLLIKDEEYSVCKEKTIF